MSWQDDIRWDLWMKPMGKCGICNGPLFIQAGRNPWMFECLNGHGFAIPKPVLAKLMVLKK